MANAYVLDFPLLPRRISHHNPTISKTIQYLRFRQQTHKYFRNSGPLTATLAKQTSPLRLIVYYLYSAIPTDIKSEK